MEHGSRWVETVVRLCNDPEARREMLWIRAMSKGDVDDACWLLESDPGIVARLEQMHDLVRVKEEAEREGGAAFERLYDEHFERLEERYGA